MATELRSRRVEDMTLEGLSERTREACVREVRQPAEHFGRSPDRITEDEVRTYFLHVKDVKKYTRGTMTIALRAIKFFYEKTLGILRAFWKTHRNPAWIFPAPGRGAGGMATAKRPLPKSGDHGAILDLCAREKHLGGPAGFFGVLHTWRRDLGHHPHIHHVSSRNGGRLLPKIRGILSRREPLRREARPAEPEAAASAPPAVKPRRHVRRCPRCGAAPILVARLPRPRPGRGPPFPGSGTSTGAGAAA